MEPTNINALYNSDYLDARSVSYESKVNRLIWWALAIVELLLIIRLIFEYFNTPQANTLTSFIYQATDYLLYPFTTLTTASGAGIYGWIAAVAIAGYLLLTIALVSFLQAKRSPRLRIEYARALSRRKYSH